MTRYTKSLGAFADVKTVFDAALAHDIVEYELPTYAKAIAWRTRAYKYRNLLLENNAAALGDTRGIAPSTPYDTIFISVMKGENKVTIRAQRPQGKLTLPGGKPLDMKKVKPAVVMIDPLQEEANRMAGEADIEL